MKGGQIMSKKSNTKDGLTDKQRKFALYYAQGTMTGIECVIKAGYSPKSATKTLYENLHKPNVVAYIQKLYDEADKDLVASAQEIKEFFTKVMRDESLPMKDRLDSAKSLCKISGLDTKIIEVKNSVEEKVAKLSDADLLALVENTADACYETVIEEGICDDNIIDVDGEYIDD